MTINFALIGAGRIGKVHAKAVMNAIPDATILAVADYHLPVAQSLAEEYGIQKFTDNHLDAINHDGVDAVIIASSTDTHTPFIIDAAKAGKHIFCEKPIAAELSKIDEALAAVESANVKLQIGFNRRFDPSFQRIKQAIDTGEIGIPHLLHIISRDPAPPPIDYIKVSGGIFFDMTIHDFDMARFLFGEVEEIYAAGAVLVDEAIGEAGDIDTLMITLKFANGAIGTVDNSRQAVYGYDQRVEVFGSKGSASNANLYPDAVTFNTADSVRRASLPMNFFLERYMAAYERELQVFVDCVVSDKAVPVTGIDGRVPVVMAMAAKKSYQENRPVKLSEISSA
jgi:myo-inositol 2-dehydrogenase / D-chiro-inositol 1-dehydrogenase